MQIFDKNSRKQIRNLCILYYYGKKTKEKINIFILGSDYLSRQSATFFYFQKLSTQHRKNEVQCAYADQATLWNAVELSEKRQKSQLARMLKASLPNEWSYEFAEEVVRNYVQRNFVDKGM